MSLFRVSFLAVALVACGSPATETSEPVDADVGESQPEFSSLGDAIVDVEQTPVKRQSIGNCWLYATASWAESLHLQQTGETVNLSESYWTYWHWYEQIANGFMWSNEISTGGSYRTAVGLILNYGYMFEGDFIPEEAEAMLSARQASALAAINASLKTGALASSEARRDRALVRAELDKAWALSPAVVAELDNVFGDGSTNLRNGGQADGLIVNASDFAVVKSSPSGTQGTPTLRESTLTTATSDWEEFDYPTSASARRNFLKRVQRALHDRQPVILTWFVDFNAMDGEGRFLAPPATPGRQGGHMVVMEDYQINNVPGYGTLSAGVQVDDSAALTAALSTSAQVEFLRIKNSWGNAGVQGYAGHHDLYMAYLNGPVQQCRNGSTTNCLPTTPFYSAVLPAGY